MTSSSTIDWHFSRFADLTPFDLYDVLAARQNVFILEQTCLYPDIDGYDLEAHHLLDQGIAHAEALHPGHRIRIGAQQYLERFYASFGFETVSAPYDEDGIMHIDMLR